MRAYLLCLLSGLFLLSLGAMAQACDARFMMIGHPGQDKGTGAPALADFKDGPVLVTGADILDASMILDHNSQPAVAFQLTPAGQARFADYTAAHIGTTFAIVYDDKLISAPRIMSPIYGGAGMITGQFTTQEAVDMAETLTAAGACAPAAGS